jgi:hypothetical protein
MGSVRAAHWRPRFAWHRHAHSGENRETEAGTDPQGRLSTGPLVHRFRRLPNSVRLPEERMDICFRHRTRHTGRRRRRNHPGSTPRQGSRGGRLRRRTAAQRAASVSTAAHRARHSRASILPPDHPMMPQGLFLTPRATFFAPRHATVHRETPLATPLSAPFWPILERAPRPAKPRFDYQFIRRPQNGLLFVLISAYLPRGSGVARTRGARRPAACSSVPTPFRFLAPCGGEAAASA